MPKQYWHCPDCGGNFDPGETCDCGKYEETPYNEEEYFNERETPE